MMLTKESSAPPLDQDVSAAQGGAAYVTDIERRLAPDFEQPNRGSAPWPICGAS